MFVSALRIDSPTRRGSCFALAALSLLVVVSSASAQLDSVNWSTVPYVDHNVYNAVTPTGFFAYPPNPLPDTFPANFPPTGFPIKFRGILLNNPEDMLSQTAFSPHPVPFNLGAMWQVYVQTVDVNNTGDFGGTAVFMGQHYGNVPPNLTFTPDPTPDPTRSYTNAEWNAEMARVNVDALTGHVFRAGDLVEIRAQRGLFFGGKMNVNEAHLKENFGDFELVLITPGVGLPAPTPLHLADIWSGDPTTGGVLFDSTRQAGGERYQGELVQLLDVHLVSDPANWGAGRLQTVADADGRTFSMLLGLNAGFDALAPPVGSFNVTGIFDQEAPSSNPTIGYRLWVMDPNAFMTSVANVPEPASLLTFATCLAAGALAWIVRQRRQRRTNLARHE